MMGKKEMQQQIDHLMSYIEELEDDLRTMQRLNARQADLLNAQDNAVKVLDQGAADAFRGWVDLTSVVIDVIGALSQAITPDEDVVVDHTEDTAFDNNNLNYTGFESDGLVFTNDEAYALFGTDAVAASKFLGDSTVYEELHDCGA